MSETLQLIFLGLIQGFTEFLPVSSSGHLELGKAFMQSELFQKNESILVTVALHVATALSTLVVFRAEVAEILSGLLLGIRQRKLNDDFLFSAKIVLSMIPAVIVGLTMKDQLEKLFSQNVLLVGVMLLITAGLLMMASRSKSSGKSVGWSDAILVGLAQMVAMLPGISRSGATISTCVMLGIDREKAARFSFLMVVPLILGYVVKSLLSSTDRAEMASANLLPLAAGFVAAFISGCIACRWMIALVKQTKLSYFSLYCAVVGVISIAMGLYQKF